MIFGELSHCLSPVLHPVFQHFEEVKDSGVLMTWLSENHEQIIEAYTWTTVTISRLSIKNKSWNSNQATGTEKKVILGKGCIPLSYNVKVLKIKLMMLIILINNSFNKICLTNETFRSNQDVYKILPKN